MISEATRKSAGNVFAYREHGRLAVVGRKEPVTVYEPMPTEAFAARKDVFETFSKGLNLFYTGEFERARQHFLTLCEEDSAAAAYAEKCRLLLEAPPDHWQGVWVMTRK